VRDCRPGAVGRARAVEARRGHAAERVVLVVNVSRVREIEAWELALFQSPQRPIVGHDGTIHPHMYC
jgi:hypothetical protein